MKIRKLSAKSFGVTIPKSLLVAIGWGEGTIVDFKINEGSILLLRRDAPLNL